MTTFTLDTSGVVAIKHESWKWEHLDLFMQGYGEAAARTLYEKLSADGWEHEATIAAVAFRNWSPSALSMILKDCTVVQPTVAHLHVVRQIEAGRDFWTNRQNGHLRRYHLQPFPPLTISFIDGKVVLS